MTTRRWNLLIVVPILFILPYVIAPLFGDIGTPELVVWFALWLIWLGFFIWWGRDHHRAEKQAEKRMDRQTRV